MVNLFTFSSHSIRQVISAPLSQNSPEENDKKYSKNNHINFTPTLYNLFSILSRVNAAAGLWG